MSMTTHTLVKTPFTYSEPHWMHSMQCKVTSNLKNYLVNIIKGPFPSSTSHYNKIDHISFCMWNSICGFREVIGQRCQNKSHSKIVTINQSTRSSLTTFYSTWKESSILMGITNRLKNPSWGRVCLVLRKISLVVVYQLLQSGLDFPSLVLFLPSCTCALPIPSLSNDDSTLYIGGKHASQWE